MPSAKLVIGSAAATAALGVRVARSLYGRWHLLPELDRRRTEVLAQDLKHKALDLRGRSDVERASEGLRVANETLAAALVETAEADPQVSPDEVSELREELRGELERLTSGDIKASRTPRRHAARPG